MLPFIDSLRKSSVDFVLTASESSAGFMASTVGYLSGVPGICVSTVGPGATNLTTGVGSAWLDRAPVLAITCNVASAWLERRIQMRIDHNALFKPLTKATLSLRDGRIGEDLAQALALATEEPPGPVHLDLPEDIAVANAQRFHGRGRVRSKLADLSNDMIQAISAALEKARRPLVITGLSFTRSKASSTASAIHREAKNPVRHYAPRQRFSSGEPRSWAGVIGRARRTDVKAFMDRADVFWLWVSIPSRLTMKNGPERFRSYISAPKTLKPEPI